MTLSPKTIRVGVALIISLIFIFAGYYFSSPFRTTIANANSSEELLRAYANKDTDGDGLPDWQEALYGTDIANPHSVDSVLTDKEAVDQGKIEPKFKSETPAPEKITEADIPGDAPASGSLTERFAKEFFQKFMLSQHVGANPSNEEVQNFVTNAIADLDVNEVQKDVFTASDVSVSGTGTSALTSYAVLMARGLGTGAQSPKKDELAYLNEAIINEDAQALKEIQQIAKAYRSMAEGAKNVPVPEELAETHLELMNATMNLGGTIEDMSAFKEDPIRTLFAIGQYQGNGIRFIRALAKTNEVFQNGGVTFSPSEPGYIFYAVLQQATGVSSSLPPQ